MAVDIITGSGAEEDRCSREIGGVTPAACGNALEDLAAAGRIIPQGGGVVCSHIAGGDGIDVDSLGGPLVRESPGQLDHAPFRRSICGNQNSALKGEHGGNVEDFSGSALLEHLTRGELGEAKYGGQIDRDDLIPIFVRILGGGRAPDNSSIVDEDIERAKFPHGVLDQSGAGLSFGEIGGKIRAAASKRLNLGTDGAGIGTSAVTGNISTSLCQGDGDGRTEASVRTGDEGGFAVELE